VPLDPETIPDPKRFVVEVTGKSARANIRKAMTPPAGARVKVGPLYEAMLIEFARERWRPSAAARSSESLRGAREALVRLSALWRGYLGEV
jgi:hypothetical protein